MKTNEQKVKKVKWPWMIFVVVVAAAVIVGASTLLKPRQKTQATAYTSYTVAKGNLTSTVTESGKLTSEDTVYIDVLDGIQVSDILVEEGDQVKAGDTLATLDTASLKDKAAELSDACASLDAQLAGLNARKTVEYVYAPVAGRIKYQPVSVDSLAADMMRNYGSLAVLSTDGLMQVKIVTPQSLAIASEVTVKWHNGSDTGKVAEKTSDGYLITLDDDKAPYQQTAQVTQESTLLGEGVLDIHAPVSVNAVDGTIHKINYELNDKVSASSKLFALENQPFTSSYRQKYNERADKAEQLQTVMKYLQQPAIVASCDGVIGTISIAEGEETGSGSSTQSSAVAAGSSSSDSSTAFAIHAGGAVNMRLDVDELDIQSVANGQEVTVTLDAMPSEKFPAKVTRISHLGDAKGSITTFAVSVTLSADERFLEGLSGSATIVVSQVSDVLVIPVGAIGEDSTGSFVLVGTNLEKKYITTGISDGKYAQVKTGVSEGALIQYIDDTATSSSTGFGPMQGSGGMRSPFDNQGSGSSSTGAGEGSDNAK